MCWFYFLDATSKESTQTDILSSNNGQNPGLKKTQLTSEERSVDSETISVNDESLEEPSSLEEEESGWGDETWISLSDQEVRIHYFCH